MILFLIQKKLILYYGEIYFNDIKVQIDLRTFRQRATMFEHQQYIIYICKRRCGHCHKKRRAIISPVFFVTYKLCFCLYSATACLINSAFVKPLADITASIYFASSGLKAVFQVIELPLCVSRYFLSAARCASLLAILSSLKNFILIIFIVFFFVYANELPQLLSKLLPKFRLTNRQVKNAKCCTQANIRLTAN